jgi:hypothetical protein
VVIAATDLGTVELSVSRWTGFKKHYFTINNSSKARNKEFKEILGAHLIKHKITKRPVPYIV